MKPREKSGALPPSPKAARLLRHRVMVGGQFVFGPGMADLLAAVESEGSLAGAARRLGMPYMRAWLLAQRMGELFSEPAVAVSRGGRSKGGATLTDTGRRALSLYRTMEADALAATEVSWREFGALLRPTSTKSRKKKPGARGASAPA